MGWDGQIIEENKMMDARKEKHNATVINHEVGMCLKFNCLNRGKLCGECYGFSALVESK